MKNLLRETHRRSVWQVLAVYVGVSWAVLQVVDVLTQNMGLPSWVFPFALVLLLLGLPMMVATAIIQGRGGAGQGESAAPAPEAASVTPPTDAGEASLHATRTRLKRMRDSVLTAAVTGQLVPQDPADEPAEMLLERLRDVKKD